MGVLKTIFSFVTRPLRNFNIENRAHKVIAKEKPTPAPLHQANIKEVEKLLRESPETFTELVKKDTVLDTHLKDIYVKSFDPIEPKIVENVNRPLPIDRRIIEFQEFGFLEPKTVPPGKLTLRQVLKLLSNHQANPERFDTAREALNNNISEEDLKNIIKYFRVYHIFMPDEKSKITYGAPKKPRKRLESGNE